MNIGIGKQLRRIAIVISLLATVGAVLGSGCARTPSISEAKTLVFGASVSLSGSGAMWGKGMKDVFTVVFEDINAAGGIIVGGQRYKIELKMYDHAFDPAKNLENIRRLVMVDKADCLYTHGAAATVGVMPTIREFKKVTFHQAAGSKVLTEPGAEYMFRNMDGTPETILVGYKYFSKNAPEVKTVSLLYPDDETGWGDAANVQKYGGQFGLTILKPEYVARTTTDFYPVLTKVIATKPDMIDLDSWTPAATAAILKQARELGYKGKMFGHSMYSLSALVEAAGKDACEGFMYTSTLAGVVDPATQTKEEKALYDKLLARFGSPVMENSFTAVQGVDLLVQAIEKAKSLDTDKLVKALETGQFTLRGRPARFCGASVYPYPHQIDDGISMVTVRNGQAKASAPEFLPTNY